MSTCSHFHNPDPFDSFTAYCHELECHMDITWPLASHRIYSADPVQWPSLSLPTLQRDFMYCYQQHGISQVLIAVLYLHSPFLCHSPLQSPHKLPLKLITYAHGSQWYPLHPNLMTHFSMAECWSLPELLRLSQPLKPLTISMVTQ